MTQRTKYSVDELDRMRSAIAVEIFGHSVSFYMNPGDQREYEANRRMQIEDRLRTYMLNGTEPEELEDNARRVPLPPVRNITGAG